MSWSEQPAIDRVRWVATSLGEPRTAHWVADEAEVSPATARKYLERLADDQRVTRIEDETRTRYYPDQVSQYLREVRETYEDHTADELAETLRRVREQIEGWRTEYDVTTPNELRATIADVDREEAEHRREVALEWDHLRSRVGVVEDALTLHDRFPGNSQAPA